MKYTLNAILFIFIVSISFAQLKQHQYQDGEQVLNGFEISPKNALTGMPGILILPAWMGIDQLSKNSAIRLSDLGYHAFIADIYGDGNYPTNTNEAAERSGFYKKNYNLYQNRIRLALLQLIKSGANPDKIVIIGYCFGGTGAIEAARGNLPIKGVVSFHGGLGKDNSRITKNILTKVLVCHGADDPYESQEEITDFHKEMRNAKADWQMIYYSNAVHSFTNPDSGSDNSKGAAYNENASKRSWQHLQLFLKETL